MGQRLPAPRLRKRRIAVCIRRFEYGGQGSVVQEELKHLRDEFTLVLFAEHINREVPSGVDGLEIETWSHFPRLNERLFELLGRFDLIHCHDSLGFMSAARSSGRPFVVTAHGIAPLGLRSSVRGMLEGAVALISYRRLYRSAALVVAISDYIAQWLMAYARVEPQVIRHGAGPLVDRVFRPNDKKLLYVGEVSRRKGISDLIASISATPPDIALDIVGRGDTHKFAKQARRQGVRDRVQFHGELSQQELESTYQQAWCTVSASRWEGFGLPVLEGFRFGRPTIVRRQGGLEELVRLSEAGICFLEREELVEAVQAVSQAWDLLSDRAREYASANSWEDTFTSYARIFRSLLTAR